MPSPRPGARMGARMARLRVSADALRSRCYGRVRKWVREGQDLWRPLTLYGCSVSGYRIARGLGFVAILAPILAPGIFRGSTDPAN